MQLIYLVAIFLGIVLFNTIVPTLAEVFCSRPWSELSLEATIKLANDDFARDYAEKYKWWKRYPVIRLTMIMVWSTFFLCFVYFYGTRNSNAVTIEILGKMTIVFLLGLPLILRLSSYLNRAVLAMVTTSIPWVEPPENSSDLTKKSLKFTPRSGSRYDFFVMGKDVQVVGKRVLFRGLGIIVVTLIISLLVL